MTISPYLRIATVLCLLPGAAACVSRGNYELEVAERQALAEENTILSADVRSLEERVAVLSDELTESEKKVADLTNTYDGLVSDLQNELASGQIEIVQMRDGIRVDISDEILFPSGSSQLDDQGREVIRRVAGQLATAPNPIRVEGHTDDVPISDRLSTRFPSNWELGAARASSVVRLLEEQGVQGKRMQAISSGPWNPRVANDSDEARARNRRIAIRLLPVMDAVPAAPDPS
jgi:chemotaxis protein MotB